MPLNLFNRAAPASSAAEPDKVAAPNAETATTTSTLATEPKFTREDVELIATRIAERIAGTTNQQITTQTEPVEESVDDATPEEIARIERIVNRNAPSREEVASYINVFNQEMPVNAKTNALGTLTQIEKEICQANMKEVENYVAHATRSNPAGRGVAEVWRRAMKLTISEHLDEVETRIVSRLQPSDLPPNFGGINAAKAMPPDSQLNTSEKAGFERVLQMNRRKPMSEEEYKYFGGLREGMSMGELTEAYKAFHNKDK